MGESVTGVRIEGLRDFAKALKAVGDEYPKAVKQANYTAATSIRDAARANADALGGVARKAAYTGLRAGRTATSGYVSLGGVRAAYAFGAEFGALKYKQFKPWLGNRFAGWDGGPGYFLHPAIRDSGPKVIDEYMARLEAIEREAFPE